MSPSPKQIFVSAERQPDTGYTTKHIAVEGTVLSAASDPLAALATQELEALAVTLDAETAAKNAYWSKHPCDKETRNA